MSTSTSVQAYTERFGALEAELTRSAPAWLVDLKKTAFARFSDNGFPDPRHEEWKYTNVRSIASKGFADPGSSEAAIDEPQLRGFLFPELEAHLMVFVNGAFRSDLSSLGSMAEGVVIRDLASAMQSDPDRVGEVLGKVASYEHSSFVALNTAFMQDGVFVDLAPGAMLDKPLHLLFVASADERPLACHPRILVHAGAGSEATLIEHYVGLEKSAGFTNVVTEIVTEANASIRHYLLQDQSQQAYHIGSVFAHQHRDSRFLSNNINLGGRLARNDINVTLAEEGAEAVLNGLFMIEGRQHTDNHTRVHHAAPHTRSQEGYRGVADGHGRGVFKGRVLVARDAQKIEAHQNSANLLLSEHAEIDTKPELEIYADDVVCSHGATVGQIDDQSLFYLRSRAIDEATARGLLVFAFADEVIERLDLVPIRAQLEHRIVGRLPDSEMLREFV